MPTSIPPSLTESLSLTNGYTEMVWEDLAPIQIDVKLGEKYYVLLEPDADAAIAYRNAGARAARFNAEGNLSGIEGIGNIEPILVSKCLYEVLEKGNLRLTPDGKPDKRYLVAEHVIRSWKNEIVTKLFDKAKEIGHLEEKETEEGLLKSIAKLQKRLDKLRNTNEEAQKKELDATSDF